MYAPQLPRQIKHFQETMHMHSLKKQGCIIILELLHKHACMQMNELRILQETNLFYVTCYDYYS